MADHVHPGDNWLDAHMRTLAHKFPTDQEIGSAISRFLNGLGGNGGYKPGPRTRVVQTPDGVVHRDPDPDGLLPTDQWRNVPRWSPPSPQLPQGWAQYGQGGTGAAPPAVPPNAPKGSVLGEDGLIYSPGSQVGIAPERFAGIAGPSQGIDDPAVRAPLDALMRQLTAQPPAQVLPKGEQPLDTPGTFWRSDPWDFLQGDDKPVLRPTGQKPTVDMPMVKPEAAPINGGGLHPNFDLKKLKPKGEGWTDGGTLYNVPNGAQEVGLRTGEGDWGYGTDDPWGEKAAKKLRPGYNTAGWDPYLPVPGGMFGQTMWKNAQDNPGGTDWLNTLYQNEHTSRRLDAEASKSATSQRERDSFNEPARLSRLLGLSSAKDNATKRLKGKRGFKAGEI